MNHAAIDLGSKHSQVCVRQSDGTIVFEKKYPTGKLAELMKTWSSTRVILETSSEAFRIADAARSAGHEVTVVPSILTKQLGVGERGVKTDERDARKLSEVSCRISLPSVHVPSAGARELRSLLQSRRTLVETRTKNINHVKGWLRTQLWKLPKGTTATLPKRVREQAASNQEAVPSHIELVLQVVELLNQQLRASDQEVQTIAKNHPVAQRLMTIPGIGPISALGFVAAIDDPTRFVHAYRVQSYLGLTPGEDSSSLRQRRTSITKAGSSGLRRTLIQAAWAAFRSYPNEPMCKWAAQIAERRGKCIAIVALARKMSGIMFALWRDGTPYRRIVTSKKTEVPTA